MFYFEVFHRASIKQQAPNMHKKHKTDDTDMINLNDGLPVVIINQTREQEYPELEYSDQNQPDNVRDNSHMDNSSAKTKPPGFKELMEAQENDRADIQTALSICLRKS